MIILPEHGSRAPPEWHGNCSKLSPRFPVSTPIGPIEFTVSIAVTACEPKHSKDSLPQMRDLLLSIDSGILH